MSEGQSPANAPLVRLYQTRSGPMLALTTDSYISGAFDRYGEYCPEEGRLLGQIINPA